VCGPILIIALWNTSAALLWGTKSFINIQKIQSYGEWLTLDVMQGAIILWILSSCHHEPCRVIFDVMILIDLAAFGGGNFGMEIDWFQTSGWRVKSERWWWWWSKTMNGDVLGIGSCRMELTAKMSPTFHNCRREIGQHIHQEHITRNYGGWITIVYVNSRAWSIPGANGGFTLSTAQHASGFIFY
jgi:hypothetical protein